MRRARWPRLSAFVVFHLACACRTPTQLTVEVTTDVPCKSGLSTAVAIGRLDDPEDKPFATTSGECGVGSVVVVPSGAKDEQLAIRVVMGVDKSPEQCVRDGYKGGCIVARRALRFIPHTELTVKTPMRGVCKDVQCPSAQTCVAGKCLDRTVIDPGLCAGKGCDESALPPAQGLLALSTTRTRATATRLPDGRILVAGGFDPKGVEQSSVEIFDPATRTFSPGPPMLVPRAVHTASLLSGKVLVVGGSKRATGLASSEIFDPATGKWAAGPTLTEGRYEHAMVDVPPISAMVIGGFTSTGCLRSTELLRLDGTEKKLGDMSVGRCFPGALMLGDGRVLVAGGSDDTGLTLHSSAEIYALSAWSTASPMAVRRGEPASALLSDGRAIFAGEESAEAFEPGADVWTSLTTGFRFGRGARMLALGGDRFVDIGGSVAEGKIIDDVLFLRVAETWTSLAPLLTPRTFHAAAVIDGKSVLVVGGFHLTDGNLSTAEIVGVP